MACRTVDSGFPWHFSNLGTAAANDGGTAAGGGGANGSGCQITSPGDVPDVVCTGPAWMRSQGGLGGASGTNIAWDDGSTMLWIAGPSDPAPVATTQPLRVWVEMKRQTDHSVPECAGVTQGGSIQIRDDGPTGVLRFMARTGFLLDDPTADELTDLFGVEVDAETTCTFDVTAEPGTACTSTRETVHDHLVHTTPPQTVPAGTTVQIDTPKGAFGVFWASRTTETVASGQMLCNCAQQLPALGFIASRFASP